MDQDINVSIATLSAHERIIEYEVSKASLRVNLMQKDQQVVIDNAPVAIRKLFRQMDGLEPAFAVC
ncbi:hypothetical protein [Leisingera sp. SS27]|uniref:hypothetical protein n=1 Tax=Leisingera sp. SS27 TaxID=2979462 RepID=UPI00232D2104|nr:hypothetical protein [Leisingera sp. SS27]